MNWHSVETFGEKERRLVTAMAIRLERERLGDSERKREAWQPWRERGWMRELKPCEKRPQIKYQ